MAKHTLTWTQAAFRPDQFVKSTLPEIAMVGRSNVGKSSLINSLGGVSHRTPGKGQGARVSSRPGCTQAAHFYLWDKQIFLVDLPGFGYAALSKTKRQELGGLVEAYFQTTRHRRAILHVADARLPLQAMDLAMLSWGTGFADFYLLLMNKCDKLSRFEKQKNLSAIKKQIPEGIAPTEIIAISTHSGEGLPILQDRIQKIILA